MRDISHLYSPKAYMYMYITFTCTCITTKGIYHTYVHGIIVFFISYQQDGATIVKANGTFTPSDCTGETKVAHLMFPNSCKLEQNVVYIARVNLKGKRFTVGTDGKQSVMGQGGVVITFHSTGLVESNHDTGPLAKFLCSRYST